MTNQSFPDLRESLALAFPASAVPEGRHVVVITGYFDESGTHEGSDNVVVAGFLAAKDSWNEFSKEWAKALVELDIPADARGVRMFHMKHFAHTLGLFKKDEWPESRRRETLAFLLEITTRHAGASVAAVVPRSLYDSLLSDTTKLFYGSPYGLAATTLLASVSSRVFEMHPDPWVAYVYESGAPGRDGFEKSLIRVINNPEMQEELRALSLRFENKRQFLPLQAADILAYELHLNWRRFGTRIGAHSRFPLQALSEMPHEWQHTDSSNLQQIDRHVIARIEQERQGRGL